MLTILTKELRLTMVFRDTKLQDMKSFLVKVCSLIFVELHEGQHLLVIIVHENRTNSMLN